MEPVVIVDLEPEPRARCNTWPLRPQQRAQPALQDQGVDVVDKDGPRKDAEARQDAVAARRGSSRPRNAWGNASYADLIAEAISSSPERRLTLAEIYRWMEEKVPYFRSAGGESSTSSAVGWKNSIRHNLSLLDRFMRVANEDRGKSSWWMLNPDAKPGGRSSNRSASRRRAASMETSKLTEQRRARAQKKAEALRKAKKAVNEAAHLPPNGAGVDLDAAFGAYAGMGSLPGAGDFRPRASSTASSYASSYGRLSPVPAVEPETDQDADWTHYFPAEILAGMRLDQGQGTMGATRQRGACHTASSQPPPQQPHLYQHQLGLHHQQQQQQCQQRHQCQQPYQYQLAYQHQPSSSRYSQPPCLYLPPSYQQATCYPSPTCQNQPSAHPSPQTYPQQSYSQMTYPPQAFLQSPCPASPRAPQQYDDLDLNVDTELNCNVEEVVKQELILEGSLDFNFGPAQPLPDAPRYGKMVASGHFFIR